MDHVFNIITVSPRAYMDPPLPWISLLRICILHRITTSTPLGQRRRLPNIARRPLQPSAFLLRWPHSSLCHSMSSIMIDFEIVTRPRHAIHAICQVFRFEADQGHIIKRHRLRRWTEDMRLNAILRDADWLPTSLRLSYEDAYLQEEENEDAEACRKAAEYRRERSQKSGYRKETTKGRHQFRH